MITDVKFQQKYREIREQKLIKLVEIKSDKNNCSKN